MQKFNFLQKITALVLISALTACATVGDEKVSQQSNETLQQKFVRGKTSKADVRTQLGKPTNITFSGNGNEQWSYKYMSTNFIKMYADMFTGKRLDDGKTIVVLFDTRGILLNYTAE